jgi:hypothetical protein
MIAAIAQPALRILTHHGTILYVDENTGELRHGDLATSPANATFAGGEPTGEIVHESGGDRRPIAARPGGCWVVDSEDGGRPSATPTAFARVAGDSERVGLTAGGTFLCAEPDGRVTLSRSECGDRELFRLVDAGTLAAAAAASLPDLAGPYYLDVLAGLHRRLQPKSYLEIGTDRGNSLALASCACIAVDPNFAFPSPHPVSNKPLCALYQLTSDEFFATVDAAVVLGRPIELAFLDGLHHCECLLRDFMNAERSCRRHSVVVLHDCLPVDHLMAERQHSRARLSHMHRMAWWAGDVWRCALLLKRRRPDLRMVAVDAGPTGLVVITNLDPASTRLSVNYSSLVEEMHSWSLTGLTLRGLHQEMEVRPVAALDAFFTEWDAVGRGCE